MVIHPDESQPTTEVDGVVVDVPEDAVAAVRSGVSRFGVVDPEMRCATKSGAATFGHNDSTSDASGSGSANSTGSHAFAGRFTDVVPPVVVVVVAGTTDETPVDAVTPPATDDDVVELLDVEVLGGTKRVALGIARWPPTRSRPRAASR